MLKSAKIPYDIQLLNWITIVLCAVFAFLVVVGFIFKFEFTGQLPLKAIIIRGDLLHQNTASLRANVIPKIKGNFYTIDLLSTQNSFEVLPWINKVSVKRVFPQRIEVFLEEHKAAAIWGERDEARMVNKFGVIFESEINDDTTENIPQFVGPDGQSGLILNMYQSLLPVFEPLKLRPTKLELSERGSWHVTLDGGASIELGRGAIDLVSERANRFVHTLAGVASKFGRNASALSYADLRHQDGYAVRLNGVSTVGFSDLNLPVKK